MITLPGQDITWGELSARGRGAFAAVGFREISHPTNQVVVHLDLTADQTYSRPEDRT